jgi:hypothetical protein
VSDRFRAQRLIALKLFDGLSNLHFELSDGNMASDQRSEVVWRSGLGEV